MHERKWIDIEPSEPTLAAYEVSKKVISQTVQREEDGAIQFWRIKFDDRNIPHKYSIGLMIVANLVWHQEEVQKGDISIALIIRDQSFTSNLLRDTLDIISLVLCYRTLMIESGIFHHIYHIGCAFNLHSVINNGLIPGGRDSSRRQTVFFLPIDPRDKDHQDPEYIDFSVPHRARYVHSAWKKDQDAVFWVDINLSIREGFTFYQTRSNAIILQGTLPAYCIPKVVRAKTREVLYERPYVSPRPPPKKDLITTRSRLDQRE